MGARLGHVFFYDWEYFRNHYNAFTNKRRCQWSFLFASFQVGLLRFRGLASHGAAISIIVAMYYLVSSETTITMDP
jgi:prolipoprotein diacylglyceryltransferase